MDTSWRIRDWSGLEELRGELETYLARRCRDANEVDDVVQETFLRAARYRRGLAEPQRLRAWVLRIASNVYRDRCRREALLPRLGAWEEALGRVEGREDDPAEHEASVCIEGRLIGRADMVAELSGAVARLSDGDRALLDSYYGGGESCSRTGDECGIQPDLVKVRLFRARRRLLAALRRRLARMCHERSGQPSGRPRRSPRLRAGVVLAVAVAVAASGGRSALAAEPAWSGTGPATSQVPGAAHPAPGAGQLVEPPPSQVLGASRPVRSIPPGLPPQVGRGEERWSKPSGARDRLAYARSLRSALRGVRGDALIRARERAIEAYRAVRAHHPKAPEVLEATFRAAELLRVAGDVEQAKQEFALLACAERATTYRTRSQLELGHIERRRGRLAQSLGWYERVVADPRARALYRDRASLWTGRVLLLQGRTNDAERVFSRIAETGFDPFQRIRAFDRMALLAIRRGDLEAAAGVLERCREVLAHAALEETQRGQRVREAIRDMRSYEEIRVAIAARATSEND